MNSKKEWLKENVDPIMKVFLSDCLKEMPSNILKFLNEWSKEQLESENYKAKYENMKKISLLDEKNLEDFIKYEKPDITSDEEDEYDEEELLKYEENVKNKQSKNSKKLSVSSEVYGKFNKEEKFVPQVIEKDEETKLRLKSKIENLFLFNGLEEKEMQIVIDSIDKFTYKKEEIIIKEGDDGNYLYIVDKGDLNCLKKNQETEQDEIIKKYEEGELFGELSLLYNTKRQATIIANSDCILFGLDRKTFNQIVKKASTERREKYDKFLNKIEILRGLNVYDKQKICDCLEKETYKKGDVIIKQGEIGESFYFIESGTAEALKIENNEEKIVLNYNENDYFGELSLLYDTPRAASIKITSETFTVAKMNKKSFQRLLGSLEQILKKNSEKYK